MYLYKLKHQSNKKMNETISLSEKMYLLAINPEKGGIYMSSKGSIDFVLIGCFLLELVQKKNIEIVEKRIKLWDLKPTVGIHRLMVERMSKAPKPYKISTWINKFQFSFRKLKNPLLDELVAKRLIRLEEKSFLFFHWKKSVLIQKDVVTRLIYDLDRMIFSGSMDEESQHLLSMIKPAELMKRLFPDKEKRRKAVEKIKQLNVDNPVSIAVTQAIRARRAAAIAAT